MVALLKQARREFARGYARASVERIAARVHLTKGAVYYHFKTKEGLFEAVFREVEREIVQRIDARARAARGLIPSIVAGCVAFLDLAMVSDLRQIGLIDAPRVLGWSRWRAIDAEFGLGALTDGLRACQAHGLAVGLDVDMLAHLISGAVNEAVFVVADADDRVAAHAAVSAALGVFIPRLLQAPTASPS